MSVIKTQVVCIVLLAFVAKSLSFRQVQTTKSTLGTWRQTQKTATVLWPQTRIPAIVLWPQTRRPATVLWPQTRRPTTTPSSLTRKSSPDLWSQTRRPPIHVYGHTINPPYGSWHRTLYPPIGPWRRTQRPIIGPWRQTQRPTTNARRQTQRPTTDPWRQSQRTTTNPRFTETTNPIETTTPQNPILCQRFVGNCSQFYDCFFTTQRWCDSGETPAVEDLAMFCHRSENDLYTFGDEQGAKYIVDYRKCIQRRLLTVVDSHNCGKINSQAQKILLSEDLASDCFYQNNTLCDVIKNRNNSIPLAKIFVGTGLNNFRIFEHLLSRVNKQCGPGAGPRFAWDFGLKFVSKWNGLMTIKMVYYHGQT